MARSSCSNTPAVTVVNGQPVPLGSNGHNTAEILKGHIDFQLAKKIAPDDPLSPTKAEAIISQYVDDAVHEDPDIRAKARESLLDRVLGKATQRTESFNLKANLSDFLSSLPEDDAADAPSEGVMTPYADALDAAYSETGSDVEPFEI